MHPGWKIYGETFFQTRTGVWPLWQGGQHWKVPSRVSGFPTLQCLSSGNSRLLLGPLIQDTSATHLVISSQQHILQMDILESEGNIEAWLAPWQVGLGGEQKLFPKLHLSTNIYNNILTLLCDPFSPIPPCIPSCCPGWQSYAMTISVSEKKPLQDR